MHDPDVVLAVAETRKTRPAIGIDVPDAVATEVDAPIEPPPIAAAETVPETTTLPEAVTLPDAVTLPIAVRLPERLTVSATTVVSCAISISSLVTLEPLSIGGNPGERAGACS